jgi:hypothetical protein
MSDEFGEQEKNVCLRRVKCFALISTIATELECGPDTFRSSPR